MQKWQDWKKRLKRKSQNQEEEKKLNKLFLVIFPTGLLKVIHSFEHTFKRLFYVLTFLVFNSPVFANPFLFTEDLLVAQNDIYHLRILNAQKSIDKELLNMPGNASALYLKDLSAFIKVFITDNPEDRSIFLNQQEGLLQKIKSIKTPSPYKAFFISEIYSHKAFLYLKEANYTQAAWSIKEAYTWLIKNRQAYPNFLPTYKNLALFEMAADNLGPSYQWILNIVGINTKYQNSLKIAESFSKMEVQSELIWLKRETAITLAYLYKHLGDKDKAWQIVKKNTLDLKENTFSLYMHSLFSFKLGMNDYTMNILNEHKEQSLELEVPFLYYIKGMCYLQKLDSVCIHSFEKYLQLQKGKQYVKSCYLKIAWAKLLHNDSKGFQLYLKKTKESGSIVAEEDKQAALEASRAYIPNITLLKVRLLFDGGYYQTALSIIRPFKAMDFKSKADQTEYCYRKARLYQVLNDDELAIAFFEACISTGKSLTQYYASYSAIYLGEIYYAQKKYDLALKYFRLATSFKNNEEYVRSIEQKSAVGIRKINR